MKQPQASITTRSTKESKRSKESELERLCSVASDKKINLPRWAIFSGIQDFAKSSSVLLSLEREVEDKPKTVRCFEGLVLRCFKQIELFDLRFSYLAVRSFNNNYPTVKLSSLCDLMLARSE